MDIFPDWLGQTGGAGTPYPVLVQGLALEVEVDNLALVVQEPDVQLAVDSGAPLLTVLPSDTVLVVPTDGDLVLEVGDA